MLEDSSSYERQLTEESTSPERESGRIPILLRIGVLYSYRRTAVLVFLQMGLGVFYAYMAGEPLVQIFSDSWMYLWIFLWALVTFLVRRAIDGGLMLYQVPIHPSDPLYLETNSPVIYNPEKKKKNPVAPYYKDLFKNDEARKERLLSLLKDPTKEDQVFAKIARLQSLFSSEKEFRTYRKNVHAKLSIEIRWPTLRANWEPSRFRIEVPRNIRGIWTTVPAELVFGILAGIFFLLGYVPWNSSIGLSIPYLNKSWIIIYVLHNSFCFLIWAIFLVSFIITYIAMIRGIGLLLEQRVKLRIYEYFSFLRENAEPIEGPIVDYHVFAERTRPIGEMQSNVTFGILAVILMLEIYWTATNILWGWDVGIMGVIITWLANAGVIALFLFPQIRIHKMLSDYKEAIRERLIVKRIKINTDLVVGTTINPTIGDPRSTEKEIAKNMKILDSLDSMIERLDDDSTWAIDVGMITQMISPILIAIPNLLIQGFRVLVFG